MLLQNVLKDIVQFYCKCPELAVGSPKLKVSAPDI